MIRVRPIMRALLAAALLAGCVLGFRGEASLSAEHDLSMVDEIRIDLPDTPLQVVGCNPADPQVCPPTLRYEALWRTVGGTRDDAEDIASDASLVFERLDRFGELRAVIPLKIRDLLDLEMGTIELPGDRDIDLRGGIGDVMVFGMDGAIGVDIDIGDIDVEGGAVGVAARTGDGSVSVRSSGIVDARSGDGRIEVRQTGASRSVSIHADDGRVILELASDANVDLVVSSPDTIRINTPAIQAITSGRFERQVGTASVTVDVRTGGGDVEIRLFEGG